jgi:hypothetical protein
MGWHYRIRKRTDKGQDWYDIVEYYERPKGWTKDSIAPGGETQEGVIECLEMMLADAKKYDILIEKEEP